jgi:uncharacterized protein YjiS (DUF1127 family)
MNTLLAQLIAYVVGLMSVIGMMLWLWIIEPWASRRRMRRQLDELNNGHS